MNDNPVERTVDTILLENKINSLPIDIFSIIDNFKIKVREIVLEDDISGVLDLRNKSMPAIFINKLHHLNRKRFSAAHELGHFLLHSKTGIHMDKNSFFRNAKSSMGLDKSEIEANRFAAEILMPKKFIIQSLSKYNDLIDNDLDIITTLADEYSVSTMAMSIRCAPLFKEMGFLTF